MGRLLDRWAVLRARIEPQHISLEALGVALALVMGTLIVALLEGPAGVPNASATYLLAVVVCAVLFGTSAAVAAAIGAFLVYDFLFTSPYYTLEVSDPDEWLNLIVLLAVGIVVGRLAATQRNRAEAALAREREARAMFNVSRTLATRTSTEAALPELLRILAEETGFERLWISMGSDEAERVIADTEPAQPRLRPQVQAILRRRPGDQPAEWARVRRSSIPGGAEKAPPANAPAVTGYHVTLEAGGRPIGALWGVRDRGLGDPDRVATRLLSAAADQIGQALEQDRLAHEAQEAEVARQSDALKTALLDSVSHDLRTPLASIRAAAGSLLDDEVELDRTDAIASAQAIDREAEYLDRLVANLLDLSRIEGGALRADREPFEVRDLVEGALERAAPRLEGREIQVHLPPDLPPINVDGIFMGQVLANLLENARRYSPATAPIRISAVSDPAAWRVRLTIEDGGQGVPTAALSRLFDKFYRVPADGRRPRSPRGTGIGLAVVRGLTEAMGGSVSARRSPLGGLAVDLDLSALARPAPETGQPSQAAPTPA